VPGEGGVETGMRRLPRGLELGRTPTLSATLVFSADADKVPDGLRVTFPRRTFKDLNGWEKTGFIMQRTSAVVGAIGLIYLILD